MSQTPITSKSHSSDWSYATQDLLDTLPKTWTRGILYLLIIIVSILIPWSVLSKVDETGTARGKLELKGDTIKREADIQESVSILKVYVKEGDTVKAGQLIMELDAKSVRDQIQQNELKLEGQQNRLNQLDLLKKQLFLAISSQQQQNKAEELKQLTQVEQARENLETLKTAYNLQKEEKLTQIQQAKHLIDANTTAYKLAEIRLSDAEYEVTRYRNLYQEGAIAETKVKEMESAAKEKLQLRNQTQAELKQSQLKFQEQQESYQRIIHQLQGDIEQAKLRLQEQDKSYQSLIQAGKLSISKIEQQVNDIDTQMTTLKSEIEQTKTQIKSLKRQLEKYIIRAPLTGTIFQLPLTREGAVVQPKQLIAEIAPKGTRLVFKGQIPTSESESIREGEKQKEVKLKFDEFPFQDYEIIKGKLIWVSPNSKVNQTPQGNLVTYDIEVELMQSCIHSKGKCVVFQSGQPATAEVIIRQRRIIDFILDPFKKLQKGDLKL